MTREPFQPAERSVSEWLSYKLVFFTAMSVDSVKKNFNVKVKEVNDASSHSSLFLHNERYNNILWVVKEAKILRKNTSHWLQNITSILIDVMKIGDMQKLIESGWGENDDSNIRYYCKTEELFDVLETAHANIGHKRTRGKRRCFVCDLQKHCLSLPFQISVSFFQSWKLNWKRSIATLLNKW